MLTKQDLQEIETVAGKVVEEKTDPKFKSIDENFKSVNKNLKAINKNIKEIFRFIKFFDREHQNTRIRVSRIEDHLKLPEDLPLQ